MQIKNKNIAFVVNSNKNFYKTTLQKCLNSLFNSGIKRHSILVIVGGFNDSVEASLMECKYRDIYDIPRIYATKSNSCDYTGFNYLIQKPESFDGFNYLFYMHDTSWVGKDFLEKLIQLTPEDLIDSYTLTNSWSMNIGLYNINYLLSKKRDIERSFNINNSAQSVNEWKKWGAIHEDYLANKQNGSYANHNPSETIKMENPYSQKTARRTRHFECLDFYKSQSNWQGVQAEMNKDL